MPLPLEATPTDPIQYAAVVALLSMMRGQMAATGTYDADYTDAVRGRNVRPSMVQHRRENIAMPAAEWASLMANR